MAEQAKVTSVEAIEAFRASLILYISKARPALEEVTTEVMRTRQWITHDQRRFWQNELKQRRKKLEHAQAELFSAMMSPLTEVSPVQQMAVRRAQESLREAEAKLRMLKHWDRELENRSEPLVKQVDQLHNFLTTDLARAVAQLALTIKALEAYADVAPAGSGPAPAPAPPEPSKGGDPA